ncbi:hypothetical protein Dimus_003993 [Dionaea muscipula]
MAAFIALSFSLLILLPVSALSGTIGINYGRIADNLPSPAQVVELLKSQGITHVKIYDTDTTVLSAFSNSGISVTVAMPNELLSSAASDQSYTDSWVQSNILSFYPSTKVEAIAVGNEVFTNQSNIKYLVPAMANVDASLKAHNLDDDIRVSSPIPLDVLQSSYPPSNGSFKSDLITSAMKPMLDFLRETSSYLMVNAYPFFAYSANSDQISLPYALFQDNPGVVDPGNGLRYSSLFDAQIDAVNAAMNAIGYADVPIVVTETGWPSKGDQNEVGANGPNAAAYNGNMVRRVLTGRGSPLRPNEPLKVFLFALFNEDLKPGPTSERNYGLFYPDEEKVYEIPLTLEEVEAGSPNNGSKVVVGPSPAASPTGQTWCVADPNVGNGRLQAALDYACGGGGADCRQIQEGATCYNPNTLVAHASYAFNSYYQLKARAPGTCDFGGAAHVVTQSPDFGTCKFPTGY